jgi:hypothetical protein
MTEILNAQEREMREEKERLSVPITYLEIVSESSVSHIASDRIPKTVEQPQINLMSRLHSTMQQKFEM